MSDTVYIPQEDSFLLVEQVKKYAKGKVLDMGCGSGIQGITALNNKQVTCVTFSDINIKALEYVETQVNAITIHSDLFKNIKSKYDTIIFNPPYLPEDEYDEETLITTGGKNGYELIEKFLEQAKSHLNIDGQILLLFSSLSDKGKIDSIIKELNYNKYELAKQGVFMEQLYVYQLKFNNPNIIKGHRGIVEIKKNIVIKRSFTTHYNAQEEAKFLKLLNKHGIGPKYISHKENELRMEYIKGDRILDYLEKANKKQIIAIITKILDQLYIMDKLKINKLELTNPYKHIIVRKHKPIQIDFERCIHTNKPKNVTQFIQFLSSGKISHIFKKKNIILKKDALMNLAKKYKNNYNKTLLKEILNCID